MQENIGEVKRNPAGMGLAYRIQRRMKLWGSRDKSVEAVKAVENPKQQRNAEEL